jgi:hypothetical protein
MGASGKDGKGEVVVQKWENGQLNDNSMTIAWLFDMPRTISFFSNPKAQAGHRGRRQVG